MRRGSCTSPVVVHCRAKCGVRRSISKQSDILRVVDSRESLYAALYARRILVDPGPDPLDACHLECFFNILFLFMCGWILVDPDVREEDSVQWIMGIMTLLMLHYRLQLVQAILPIAYGSGYLQSGSAHRRRTLAYLQSRDEPIKALGSSHMTK